MRALALVLAAARMVSAEPSAETATEPTEEIETPPSPAATGTEPSSPSEPASAAGPEAAPVAESPVAWTPPLPDAEAFDWLQVDSGEWVKGDFETLRDYRVQFDSDEFDELDLDWEDVTAFHLPRPHAFRARGRVYFGTAELRDGVLRIRSGDEVHEFEKADLDSVAQGSGERELDFWSAKVGASLSARQGNSDESDLTGTASIRRETALSRLRLSYNGAFSKVEGEKTANNHRVNLQSDLFVTRRFFVTVPFAEYYTDEFQNIEARVTSGLGVGYEIVRRAAALWEVTLGAGHQYTRISGGTDEPRTSHDAAVVAGTKLELDITSDIELDNSYAVQLVATDFDKTSHHAQSVLSFDIWGPLDFDVTFVWDRTENPPDAKPDDFRLMVGLELDL